MKTFRLWSVEDRQKVRANYGRMTAAELAEMLGRTQLAVWREASRLGVTNQVKQYAPKRDDWYPVQPGQLAVRL